MKVLALNSSARTGHESKTEMLLDALVKGMREAGAEVEVVNLRKKKINYCAGCFTCWTKTPGKCIHQDDMTGELLDKWVAADLCVYATPLFHYTVNAQMKTFIERTLPAIEPYMIVQEDGEVVHPHRYDSLPEAVILSVAGFPHMEVFDVLSHYVQFLFGKAGGLKAEIYRPGAEFLDGPFGEPYKKAVLEATRQAGSQLITDGAVADTTMAEITKPIGMNFDEVARVANMFWDTAINAGVSPREFGKQKMVPRPHDIADFLLLLQMGFNPAKAGDFKCTIQYDFTGQAEGSCYMTVADGAMQTGEGPAESADAVINTPFELWADVMSGKTDPAPLFMSQQIKATGDLAVIMGMQQLFA